MMAGFRFITAGERSDYVKLPAERHTKFILSLQTWPGMRKIITANKRQLRQLTIAVYRSAILSVSNHEHEALRRFSDYLSKKAGKGKRWKNKKSLSELRL